MSNPYVRTIGQVEDLDGRKVDVGVDYDSVMIDGGLFARFTRAQAEDFARACSRRRAGRPAPTPSGWQRRRAMLNFGAESPTQAIDYAALSLYVDDLDFVCLRVKIDNRDIDVLVRLGQPTARDLGKAMMEMAKPKEASDGF